MNPYVRDALWLLMASALAMAWVLWVGYSTLDKPDEGKDPQP